MNVIQRIAKNTTVLLVSQVIGMFFSFFTVMFAARYLGTEGYGIISFATAFAGMLHIFADLGLYSYTVREVSRDLNLTKKFVGMIIPIKCILSVFYFIITAVIINILGYEQNVINVVYIITFSYVLYSFLQMLYSVFQSYEKMEYMSICNVINSGLLLVGIIYAINQNFTVFGFACIYIITNTITLSIAFLITIRLFVKIKIKINIKEWIGIIKISLPFAIVRMANTIYFYIDSVMLSYVYGQSAVGLYNAAYGIVFSLNFVPLLYGQSIYPMLSRLFKTSKKEQELLVQFSFRLMTIFAIPLGIGITLLSDKIILLIFGDEFFESIFILQILIWAIVFKFINSVFLRFLYASDKEIITTKIILVGVIVNIVMNIFLIPSYSYFGAAFATVTTEFILLIGLYYYSSYKMSKKDLLIFISKIGIATIAMASFIYYFHSYNLAFIAVFGTAIYFLIFYLVKGLDEQDIVIIKQLGDGIIFNRNKTKK